MQDAWRAYLELALGLTEASRKRAQAAARKLAGSSGATAAQLQAMAEELISTGLANREALTKIIRAEVDRALGVLGLATSDEVAALTERVQRLERELATVRAASATGGVSVTVTGAPSPGDASAAGAPTEPAVTAAETAPPTRTAAKSAATKATGKKTVAKKAVAKKTAKKAVAKRATAVPAVGTAAGAQQALAEHAPGGRTVAKKVAKKTVAKKVQGTGRSSAAGGGAA